MAEIVALTLGGLPIAISIVEHYRDGLRTIKNYRTYHNTLTDLRTRLRIQQELYVGTLKRVLLPELSIPEAVALFPSSQDSVEMAVWRTSDIEAKLRQRLGSQYDIFMEVIGVMEARMQKLVQKLDIDIEGKPSWIDVATLKIQSRKRIEWEWRKIRRSFGRKERDELIGEFERYNRDIRNLVEQPEILVPPRVRGCAPYLDYIKLIRDHACGLYEVVEPSWKCDCLKPHCAKLQLDARESAQGPSSFQVRFSFYHRLGIPQQRDPDKEVWQETQIDIGELDTSHPSTLGAAGNEQLNPDSSIKSLCEAIQDAHGEPRCLGVLADTARKRSISITTTIVPSPAEPVSLESLLWSNQSQSQQCTNMGKLSKRQRLEIAVILASSILQLHQSPWLSEIWSKSDIYFFFSGLNRDKCPLIDHAYVSRKFQSLGSTDNLQNTPEFKNQDSLDCWIVEKTLFALGIVLIELCLNRPLEDLSSTIANKAVAEPRSLIGDYQTALSNMDAVFDEGGEQYAYVVQRCLKCEFGLLDREKHLDSDYFKGLVYEGVIVPLKENLRQFDRRQTNR